MNSQDSKKIGRIPNRENYIINIVKNKSTLHIGCTDFPYTKRKIEENNLLHKKISDASLNTVGIDLSEEGIRVCAENGIKNVIHGNAENLSEYISHKFDVIVAGEVVEHVNNPGLLLQGIANHLTNESVAVITVPNAFFIIRFLKILFGNEEVHPDHVCYYSKKTLEELLSRYDLHILDCGYNFEFGQSSLLNLLKIPLYFLYKINPELGQSLIVTAKRGSQISN